MKKKIVIVIWIILILFLLSAFFLIFGENEKKDNKVWMAKIPHQCGDNTVPNDIYFDYPNTLFPNNERLPDFPINFSQKQNAIEFYNKEIKYYEDQMRANGQSEAEINDFTTELMKHHTSLDLLSKEEIIIYGAKKIHSEGVATCGACFCSVGYTVYLLIKEENIDVLLELGYGQTEEPITSK